MITASQTDVYEVLMQMNWPTRYRAASAENVPTIPYKSKKSIEQAVRVQLEYVIKYFILQLSDGYPERRSLLSSLMIASRYACIG